MANEKPDAKHKDIHEKDEAEKLKKSKKAEKSPEEIEEEEREDFVRRVLGNDDEEDKGIKRGFNSSRKEKATAAIIESAKRFQPDYLTGLTADQAQERMTAGLGNKADSSTEKTIASIFAQNLLTFFNLLCVVVAVALIIVKSYTDLMFFALMIVNAGIGIFQEIKAKLTVDKLSIISAPVAIVVRNAERLTIPIEEVVLDDIMFLENGKQICADAIVKKGRIEVNEAMLTGESQLVTKNEGDTLYAGSFVSSGSCYAKVEKVGNANYIEGLTAFAKRFKKSKSELLTSLKRIVNAIAILIVPLAILMYRSNILALGMEFSWSLDATVVTRTAGAIIGMIPAGMFLLTSIALFSTVVKLSGKRVLVQDLYCIELLARTNILCLDKTGTITDGTMRVSEVISYRTIPDYNFNDIIGSVLTATGDNNQTAMALANHFGYSKALKATMIFPFSSQRKLSAATFEGQGTFFIGAPEFVMPEMDVKLAKLVSEKAAQGLRVMMLAHTIAEIKGDRLPAGRKVLAIICIEDHIREDAVDTIKWFKDNDVAVKVISGDNPITVSEVAQRVGIKNAELYISLEGLSDQEVVQVANQYTVFGRVTPEQKRILIRAMKVKGNTVAMTGDGVNDILALKEADCSIAMAAGSEAARNVSHMVLQDSNFGNMPSVVIEGRRVVNNIQKSASLYLMKTLFSIIMSIIIISMTELYPITPSNLMLLELMIIGIPSFALAFQTNTKRIEGKFLSNVLKSSLSGGLSLICGFLALYILRASGIVEITDASFTSMTVIIITFVGWIMLFRLCLPLNPYRGMLCAVSLLGCILAVALSAAGSFLQTAIKVGPIEFIEVLFVLVVILSSYAFAAIISAIGNNIKIDDGASS